MFRRLTLTLTASLALAALTPALVAAQDAGPLRIEITDGVVEPMSIAIPAFFGDDEVARKVREVVADDLTGTGLFREIPADAQTAKRGSFTEPVSYEDWRRHWSAPKSPARARISASSSACSMSLRASPRAMECSSTPARAIGDVLPTRSPIRSIHG